MPAFAECQTVGVLKRRGGGDAVAAARAEAADAGDGKEGQSGPRTVATRNADLLRQVADMACVASEGSLVEMGYADVNFIENMRTEGVIPVDDSADRLGDRRLRRIDVERRYRRVVVLALREPAHQCIFSRNRIVDFSVSDLLDDGLLAGAVPVVAIRAEQRLRINA